MMGDRPKWDFKMPEITARWIAQHTITKIEHHWKFTSEDTSTSWLTFNDGKKTIVVPTDFQSIWEIEFCPDHCKLIAFKRYSDIELRLDEIDAFEKKNKRERSEYTRLKKKFET